MLPQALAGIERILARHSADPILISVCRRAEPLAAYPPPGSDVVETGAAVAKDAGVSQADAGRVLDAIVKNIHKSLVSGSDVRISNLGVFDTAERAEREGRNPATGATIKIAASKAVRFRVSKPLKDAVNG